MKRMEENELGGERSAGNKEERTPEKAMDGLCSG